MIKLIDILKEVAGTYRDGDNIWTHGTNRDETISTIKSTKKFFGPGETAGSFEYDINKGLSPNRQNYNSPNFFRGKLYPGVENSKYLITFEPKQKYPGDDFDSENWSNVDYPLIPNGNRMNRRSFKKSDNIGIIKPEYRDIKNFKFYKKDPNTNQFVEFDINK